MGSSAILDVCFDGTQACILVSTLISIILLGRCYKIVCECVYHHNKRVDFSLLWAIGSIGFKSVDEGAGQVIRGIGSKGLDRSCTYCSDKALLHMYCVCVCVPVCTYAVQASQLNGLKLRTHTHAHTHYTTLACCVLVFHGGMLYGSTHNSVPS